MPLSFVFKLVNTEDKGAGPTENNEGGGFCSLLLSCGSFTLSHWGLPNTDLGNRGVQGQNYEKRNVGGGDYSPSRER